MPINFLPWWLLAPVAIIVVTYLVYQAAMPTTLPGIPYKTISASRLLGDLPDMLSYMTRTKQTVSFFASHCVELNSPVTQIFIRPFLSKPWVIITDSREAQDILTRRTREFDRGEIFGHPFRIVVPHAGAGHRTTSHWRESRRLMADTMSPSFLRNVAGPHNHSDVRSVVQLWKAKGAAAKGRPFDIASDLEEVMNDSIFAVAFGVSRGGIGAKLEALSYPPVKEIVHDHEVIVFPTAKRSAVYEDIGKVLGSPEIALKSPFGAWHLAFALKFYPKLRLAVKRKDRFIQQMLDEAWEKFNRPTSSEADVKSAAEFLIAREVAQSKKSGRKAQYDSPMVKDELFLFLFAGFDTGPTTVKWGFKFLTRYQEVQAKLRNALRESLKDVCVQGELPTLDAIHNTKIPYLDAFLEEMTRSSHTSLSNGRITTQDVEVLGYHIPKGIEVWLMNVGPSQTAPPFDISDSRRRSGNESEAPKSPWTETWDPHSLAEFMPERWLRTSEDGTSVFDPQAGPNHAFGVGPRGCFGRKLAMHTMKTLFVLVLWEFELLPLPTELDSFAPIDLLTHQPLMNYVRLQSHPLG
ncbi:hypothetical protein COCC4DRAFT_174025 [Bipolaris maydis ATCC 48331]|uniref:Cytochrome P450 monooxygenase n=2 Tax=Cochliobolus heterostrophus TaxID=5016 RepID=M2UW20_COCH5|nr:uncharacterized protein COCC4DRAFT_174025 [Bipolaris maydis ATCC 48331]EMD97751.1 hypothetical protein COCHEDRAFT_1125593 [Bipolaris maydis C5]KAJ5031832.1 cytochrome P450 [Bipolaris maydis]ENI02854.1 hypothetical protein COCC4DRAFT_174025 [Bipolaris maydis ATCC 48331]KAJ5060112.1 cytochrome P450 [Bipolaris maydis]KAJ6202093.1 cytochrome P450 [Bipolaris maydis]